MEKAPLKMNHQSTISHLKNKYIVFIFNKVCVDDSDIYAHTLKNEIYGNTRVYVLKLK